MLNKMGGKNKYIPIKAKGGTNNKKRRKMGVTKKQQKQIAQMNELKKTGNPEVDEASQEDSGPSIEMKFAQKLAANEPKTRDKAISKLRKWLQGSYQSLSQLDMLRLWKGLHYCFWMSDKPLVQEELAENISNIVHCFDCEKALLYLECFLITLGREWIGIDRWRNDKFMMFARRILRQALLFVMKQVEKTESDDALESFVGVIDGRVISAEDSKCAVGFKLHFIDIFMEELTKVNATFDRDLLTDDRLETLLEPFLRHIVAGRESRLVEQIEERIFNHLIRQSDVALAYEEGSDQEMEDEESDLLNGDKSDGEEEEVEEEQEGEGEDGGSKFDLLASDPRAGVGDVCLPQLDLDYNRLAEVLFKAGGETSVGPHQRKRLYGMSKRFQLLASGVYPFAAELNEEGEVVDHEEGIEEIDLNREVAKEHREVQKEREQAKADRREYKQALKNKRSADHPSEVEGAAKKAKKEKKKSTTPDKKKGNKEKSRERIEKFMEKKRLEKEAKAEAEKQAKGEGESEPKVKSNKKKSNKSESKASESTEVNGQTQSSDKSDQNVDSKTESDEKPIKKKKSKGLKTLDNASDKQDVISEEKQTEESSTEAETERKPSKKKKKKMKDAEETEGGQTETPPETPVGGEPKSSKKDKKRKATGETPVEKEPKKSKSVVEGQKEEEESPRSAFAVMDSARKKKKKSKEEKVKSKPNPAFEVDSWDEPIQEGELEMVEANPKYQGEVKLAPAAEPTPSLKKKKSKKNQEDATSDTPKKSKKNQEAGVAESPQKSKKKSESGATNGSPKKAVKTSEDKSGEGPSISTPENLPKTQFFRKAVSKSAQKDPSAAAQKTLKDLTMSEPSKKLKKGNKVGAASDKSRKLNFALSQNKFQNIKEVDRSMQESPDIPFDAERMPSKGLLKVTASPNPTSTPKNSKKMSKQQSVMYNTMMNSKSPFAAKRRPVASDFFDF